MNTKSARGVSVKSRTETPSFKTSKESADTLWQQITLKTIPLLKGEKGHVAIEELNDIVL
jgi:hypothetical protein